MTNCNYNEVNDTCNTIPIKMSIIEGEVGNFDVEFGIWNNSITQ